MWVPARDPLGMRTYGVFLSYGANCRMNERASQPMFPASLCYDEPRFSIPGGIATMKGTVLAFLASLSLACAAMPLAQEPVVRITPDKLKWESKPEDLGFSQAIVEGDPAKPGLYIIQVKYSVAPL